MDQSPLKDKGPINVFEPEWLYTHFKRRENYMESQTFLSNYITGV